MADKQAYDIGDKLLEMEAALSDLEPKHSPAALESMACSNHSCPVRDKCALGTRSMRKVWTWEKFQGWAMTTADGNFWQCSGFTPSPQEVPA